MCDAGRRDLLGSPATDVVLLEPDAPAGVDESRQRPERRRLPGTVGAEDHHDLALVDREVEPVQHPHRAVAAGQLLHREHAHCSAHAGVPRYASMTRGSSRICSGAPSAILEPKSSTTIWSEMAITIAM